MEVERESQGNYHAKLHKIIAEDSLDFNSWSSLISEIEKIEPESIDTISLVYDSFLSKFPLCHWYWTKYAHHKARLCTISEAVEIFERAIESATFSVGLWLAYCTFTETFFNEPSDIRRIYERGISFIGKDYFCHVLWDKYMQFELSQKQWNILPQIYIQTLKFPTNKLHLYYDNFHKFISILEEEIKCKKNCDIKVDPVTVKLSKDEICQVLKDIQDHSDVSRRSRAIQKYKTIGEQVYQRAFELDEKIKTFETSIQRRYFQVTPLDDNELSNWHQYLDFIEKQEDFDWALKLYERCLISCANYPEFWLRYVEYLESKRGRPLAIFALDRATKIYLKDVPEIHLFSARFKEQIGDLKGARDAYLHCNTNFDAFFTENVVRQANMEKRLGNLVAASKVYEKAIKTAKEQQKVHLLPDLYIHFSRLKYIITDSLDAARDVIVDGIHQVPNSRALFQELMKFGMTNKGCKQMSVIDSLVAKAILPGSDVSDECDTKDKADISCLFLEFVDLCGSLDDYKKAWARHIKLFPQFIRPSLLNKGPSQVISLEQLFGKQDKETLVRVEEASLNIDQNEEIDTHNVRDDNLVVESRDSETQQSRTVTETHKKLEEEVKMDSLKKLSLNERLTSPGGSSQQVLYQQSSVSGNAAPHMTQSSQMMQYQQYYYSQQQQNYHQQQHYQYQQIPYYQQQNVDQQVWQQQYQVAYQQGYYQQQQWQVQQQQDKVEPVRPIQPDKEDLEELK